MGGTGPLSALVVNEGDLFQEELAEVLASRVRLTPGGGFVLEPGFDRLGADRKVCCALLAVKAAAMLELRRHGSARPRELERLTGMPGGTIRPALAHLLKSRIVTATGSDYEVPGHAVRRAAAYIGETL